MKLKESSVPIKTLNMNLLRFAFSAARMKSSKVKSIVLQSEKKNIEKTPVTSHHLAKFPHNSVEAIPSTCHARQCVAMQDTGTLLPYPCKKFHHFTSKNNTR